MIKKFKEWILVKNKIDDRKYKPPYVQEHDIWWVNIGENVGREINGKGDNFARPVYIYKKLSLTLFLCIPMTSKIKIGSWFVQIKQSYKISTLCLHQIRIIDYKRLMN